jgi:hypothetical protein
VLIRAYRGFAPGLSFTLDAGTVFSALVTNPNYQSSVEIYDVATNAPMIFANTGSLSILTSFVCQGGQGGVSDSIHELITWGASINASAGGDRDWFFVTAEPLSNASSTVALCVSWSEIE